jgi:transcriptional regulator with XRE-family HTH domain
MASIYAKRAVNNLRRLIANSGKTARRVAIEAGIDESTISKYLSGQRQPQIDVLEKIAKSLGKDFKEFFEPN